MAATYTQVPGVPKSTLMRVCPGVGDGSKQKANHTPNPTGRTGVHARCPMADQGSRAILHPGKGQGGRYSPGEGGRLQPAESAHGQTTVPGVGRHGAARAAPVRRRSATGCHQQAGASDLGHRPLLGIVVTQPISCLEVSEKEKKSAYRKCAWLGGRVGGRRPSPASSGPGKKKTLLRSARATSGSQTGRGGRAQRRHPAVGQGLSDAWAPYPSQQNPLSVCHSRGLLVSRSALKSFPECGRGKLSHSSKTTGWMFVSHCVCIW